MEMNAAESNILTSCAIRFYNKWMVQHVEKQKNVHVINNYVKKKNCIWQ